MSKTGMAAGDSVRIKFLDSMSLRVKSDGTPYQVGEVVLVKDILMYPTTTLPNPGWVVVDGMRNNNINGVQYLKAEFLNFDWIELVDAVVAAASGQQAQTSCVCPIMDLMARGCKCGWLEIERKQKI